MNKLFKITPDDFHLLMQEISALTDLIADERLKRREEVGMARIEMAALKQTLARYHSDFEQQFTAIQSELLHNFDPEVESTVSNIKRIHPAKDKDIKRKLTKKKIHNGL